MTDTYSAPEPAPEAAPDQIQHEVVTEAKDVALANLAKSEDATAYIHERQDREAEDRGEEAATPPHERAERLREALRAAKQEAADAADTQPEAREPQEHPNEGELTPEFEARLRAERAMAAYSIRAQEFAKSNPEYWENLRSTFSVWTPNERIAGQILESPVGPQIVSRLTQNPEAIEELNALPPAEATKILNQLEGFLIATGELQARQVLPQPRRETKAPPILRAPKGAANPPKNAHALASKSEDVSDYVRFRNEQERRRG